MKKFLITLILLIFFSGLLVSVGAYADCKTVIWKNYHQYQTKGNPRTIQFKLAKTKVDSTTVWLHCSSGTANQTLLKEVSNNAQCRLVHGSEDKTVGVHCRYKPGKQKPCIQVKLACQ